jgi:transposase
VLLGALLKFSKNLFLSERIKGVTKKMKMKMKMMPPNAMPVQEVRHETGVTDVTLYKWSNEYRNKGIAVPGDDIKPDNWKGQEKLAVVIETAASNESEPGDYCRKKELYPEQIHRRKEPALKGYDSEEKIQHQQTSSRKEDRNENKKLQS